MDECEALCNRLAIIVDGKLVCIGPPQELKRCSVEVESREIKGRNFKY